MRPYRVMFCFVDNRMTYRFDVMDALGRPDVLQRTHWDDPMYYNGRTDRASLQGDVTDAVTFDTTDAQTVRPYRAT